MSGDTTKKSEGPPRLDWQSELDETMAEIDSRLTHPRRRASDRGPQPALPGLGEMNLTSEQMDEIAWRVAEEMRRSRQVFPVATTTTAAVPRESEDEGLRPGKMVAIRFRLPALPWPFRLLRRRRREHPLTTAKLRA